MKANVPQLDSTSLELLQYIHDAGVIRGFELIGEARVRHKIDVIIEAVQELQSAGLIKSKGSLNTRHNLMDAVISIRPSTYKMTDHVLKMR